MEEKKCIKCGKELCEDCTREDNKNLCEDCCDCSDEEETEETESGCAGCHGCDHIKNDEEEVE